MWNQTPNQGAGHHRCGEGSAEAGPTGDTEIKVEIDLHRRVIRVGAADPIGHDPPFVKVSIAVGWEFDGPNSGTIFAIRTPSQSPRSESPKSPSVIRVKPLSRSVWLANSTFSTINATAGFPLGRTISG